MPKKTVSEDDKRLFRQSIGDVRPLPESKKKSLPERIPEKKSIRSRIESRSSVVLSDYIAENVTGDTILYWSAQPLPAKRFRELKNGLIPYTDRLDLHGLSVEDARTNLLAFLDNVVRNEHRCVLIIHGKGGHRGEYPIIKNLVHRWLPQHPLIRAYHSATPRHGGTGAMYVLLKKIKI